MLKKRDHDGCREAVEGTWRIGINFHRKSIPYLDFTGPKNQKRLTGLEFNVSQVGR
jgi:hypothetical protein